MALYKKEDLEKQIVELTDKLTESNETVKEKVELIKSYEQTMAAYPLVKQEMDDKLEKLKKEYEGLLEKMKTEYEAKIKQLEDDAEEEDEENECEKAQIRASADEKAQTILANLGVPAGQVSNQTITNSTMTPEEAVKRFNELTGVEKSEFYQKNKKIILKGFGVKGY